MKRTKAHVATWLTVIFVSLIGFAAESSAQGVQTGTIRGTVVDPQGLPVGNVTVTITSKVLQGQRTATTAADGSYVFRQLPAGDYVISFETTQFAPASETTAVMLGLTVEQNVTLQPAGVSEQVQVVAETPAPIATPTIGANFKHDEIDALANQRNLFGIAQLAPGLTTNTPNAGQITINGAFAFDNVFMLNGVDLNDNLFGSPQDLFIEDAIEETSVLTSGITAEYGRFTGGVVNAITKSGGNSFSGSYRLNLQNPRWAKQTPLELCDPAVTVATCRVAPQRPDDLQMLHEGTFGGYIVKDRLWFFASGRQSELSNATPLPLSGFANTQLNKNKRGEIKLTGTVAPSHTVAGGYLNNSSTQESRPSFGFTVDTHSVGERTLPNSYYYTNYRGVLKNNLLAEAQFSQRKFGFRSSGGSSTNIIDSPILALNILTGGNPAHYNAEYFDDSDPENRNNFQLTGNLTYFLSTANSGRHEIKGGYEFFRSQRTGGNSQSSTGFVFDADYVTDASGTAPMLDPQGYFIPIFTPGETLIENWLPTKGAELNVDNNSFYLQDHWAINGNWSADLGLRYERARSEATGGIVGVDTDTIVPRLGVGYDIAGDGKHVLHVTYGHYAGRYNEAQIGNNNNVGNPDVLLGVYNGPAGRGRGFAPGFNPANYVTALGQFPTANIFFEDGLSSPVVKEFTTSYGMDVMNGKGFGQVAYIWRDWNNFIEDYISIANGTTNVVKDGFDVGTFTNIEYRNTNDATRAYQALEFQARYNIQPRWTVNGNWTVQLDNEGNYTGEAANQPGVTGRIGDYPEIFNAARHYPDGRLPGFQRNKVRLWSVYNLGFGKFGDGSISGLMRVDSATTYSLAATNQPITSTQRSRLVAAGYPDEPQSQTVYFEGERGIGTFKGYGVFDLGLGYNIPVFRTLRPWLRLDVYNFFNNQKLIGWNTTVTQDPTSPVDEFGLRTGYREGGSFGRATSSSLHFPIPFQGETGGRTYRFAMGVRF
jgi:outer membrane receptor protein involved in Fe transport